MENILKALQLNLIKDNRYLYILDGLKNTMIITIFATILGIILGLIVALIRTTYDNNKKSNSMNSISQVVLKIANSLCNIYLTVIRGTPVVIQLMILFFCIFSSREVSGVMIAIIGFGINSGAYVAEVFRSGLMSIDIGQMEAGRSLGLSYIDTMKYIIIPQAFNNGKVLISFL